MILRNTIRVVVLACVSKTISYYSYHVQIIIITESGLGESSEALPQSLDLVSKQRREKIDCELSQIKYTPCNSTCGESYKWKYRDVVVSSRKNVN